MPIPIPTVHLGMGATTMLVATPLALKLVPRNRYYGVRTRPALAADRSWYAINAYGGQLLLIFGALLAGFGLLTRPFAPPPTSLWAPLFFLLPFPPLLVVLSLIKRYSRRFSVSSRD